MRLYDPGEEKYWTAAFVVPLLKRVVLFALISNANPPSETSSTDLEPKSSLHPTRSTAELENLFMQCQSIEDDLDAEDWVGKAVLAFTGKSFESYLSACFESINPTTMNGCGDSGSMRFEMALCSSGTAAGESIDEAKSRMGLVGYFSQ